MIRFFSVLITLFMAMTLYAGGGDKIIAKQGKKPKWAKKVEKGTRFVGKTQAGFRGRKSAGFEKSRKSYFFVSASEAKTPPYEKDDIAALAKLKAGSELATSICSELATLTEASSTIAEGKKQDGLKRLNKLSSVAKFSGFVLTKEYWEMFERAGVKYYAVYQLYSIEKAKVKSLLEKVATKVGVPDNMAAEAEEQLEGNLDDINLDDDQKE